jgi:hypothetical protein
VLKEVVQADNIYEYDLDSFFDSVSLAAIFDRLSEGDCPGWVQKLLASLVQSKPLLPVRSEWKIDESGFLPKPTFVDINYTDDLGSRVSERVYSSTKLQTESYVRGLSAFKKSKVSGVAPEEFSSVNDPRPYLKNAPLAGFAVPQGGSLSPPLSTLALENSVFKMGELLAEDNSEELLNPRTRRLVFLGLLDSELSSLYTRSKELISQKLSVDENNSAVTSLNVRVKSCRIQIEEISRELERSVVSRAVLSAENEIYKLCKGNSSLVWNLETKKYDCNYEGLSKGWLRTLMYADDGL